MYSKDIEEFIKWFKDRRDDLRAANDTLNYCNDKTQDLWHKLELEESTLLEKAFMVNDLANARRERRKAKDAIEQLTPIIEFSDNNKRFIDLLSHLLGNMRKIEKQQETRTYLPKTEVLHDKPPDTRRT